MNLLRRLLARLRRPAPHYGGWQDFEPGRYVTDPHHEIAAENAERERARWRSSLLPDLQPWQVELLRHHGWTVRDRLLRAHRRPEDAYIKIHGFPTDREATVYGIPVRFDLRVPPGVLDVEMPPYPAPDWSDVGYGAPGGRYHLGRWSWRLP